MFIKWTCQLLLWCHLKRHKTAAQLWLEEKLKNPQFQSQYKKDLAELKDEQKVLRKLRREEWVQEAFKGYADSEVEKVWEEINDEDFVD